MTHSARVSLIALFGGIALILTPANGPAQIQMGGGVVGSFPGPNRTFPVGPLGVPYSVPSFQFNSSLGVSVGTPFGPSIGYSQRYTGALGWWLYNGNTPLAPRYYTYPGRPNYNTPSNFLSGSGNGGYMSGGVGNSHLYNAQQDLARAQQSSIAREYSGARSAIVDQWATEKGVVNGPKNLAPGANANLPQDLLEALSASDLEKLMSGAYLNRIAAAITATEARGGKGTAAQLGPQLLSEMRFSGSPAADALNVIRRAGRIEFPAAFQSVDALKLLKPELEQDIVAVAGPAKLGKPVDPLKAAKFETDVKKAQDALTPALGSLPFEDAVAARRFLNQLDGAAKVMKDQRQLQGLINPQWETAGIGVPELVKYMTKYKILFAPGESSAEEAYFTVHQSLAGYLFVLEQSVPAKK